jgi:uncharacterized protein YgiM (DUF1202 family)
MKLTKPVKTALVVLPFVIGGLLLIKFFRPKKTTPTPPKPNPPEPNPIPPSLGFEKYVVTTNTSNLNVRSGPSTSSSIVGTLVKGTEIFAKPSGTSGWHEYSSDGKTSSGFVSSQYVTKK